MLSFFTIDSTGNVEFYVGIECSRVDIAQTKLMHIEFGCSAAKLIHEFCDVTDAFGSDAFGETIAEEYPIQICASLWLVIQDRNPRKRPDHARGRSGRNTPCRKLASSLKNWTSAHNPTCASAA